jgi:hypothetical protein
MDPLELIFGGLQLCDCFLGLMTLISASGSAVEAKRGAANRQERRLAKQAGEKPPPVSGHNWAALFLFLCAVIFLLVLVITWLASRV